MADDYGRSPPWRGKEAEVADAHKAARQHMQQKPAQEFVGGDGHFALLVAVGIILPPERDLAIGEGDESVVGNGHAMGVERSWFSVPKAARIARSSRAVVAVDAPAVHVRAALALELCGVRYASQNRRADGAIAERSALLFCQSTRWRRRIIYLELSQPHDQRDQLSRPLREMLRGLGPEAAWSEVIGVIAGSLDNGQAEENQRLLREMNWEGDLDDLVLALQVQNPVRASAKMCEADPGSFPQYLPFELSKNG